jgi:hypothetical protein
MMNKTFGQGVLTIYYRSKEECIEDSSELETFTQIPTSSKHKISQKFQGR